MELTRLLAPPSLCREVTRIYLRNSSTPRRTAYRRWPFEPPWRCFTGARCLIAIALAKPSIDQPNPVSVESRADPEMQARFQLRQMDDATECLDAVLSDIHRTMSPNQDGTCQPQCVAHEYV